MTSLLTGIKRYPLKVSLLEVLVTWILTNLYVIWLVIYLVDLPRASWWQFMPLLWYLRSIQFWTKIVFWIPEKSPNCLGLVSWKIGVFQNLFLWGFGYCFDRPNSLIELERADMCEYKFLSSVNMHVAMQNIECNKITIWIHCHYLRSGLHQ